MALTTLVAYALAGGVVAALLAARSRESAARRAGAAVLHASLWPLFIPLLLPTPPTRAEAAPGGRGYEGQIDRAERSLAEALGLLGRDLEDPLSLEATRVRALGQAMRAAAQRQGELDGLLSSHGAEERELTAQLLVLRALPESAPLAEIVEQQLGHMARLRALRNGARADLERAIARAGELSTRLTLLRYEDPTRTGAAATKARELTDSIEELCRVLSEVRAA